jgi:hypothetical protein
VSYEIEDISAFNKLSSSGALNYGDTVTLLFDINDKVADVLAPQAIMQKAAYLIDTGFRERINENEEKSFMYFARLATVDGDEMEYTTDKDYSTLKGKLVKITFIDEKAKLTTESKPDNIFGEFNWNSKTFGSYTVAQDVKILDLAKCISFQSGKYKKIFPRRIDMVKIPKEKVLYAGKNEKGEISSLILDNLTNLCK